MASSSSDDVIHVTRLIRELKELKQLFTAITGSTITLTLESKNVKMLIEGLESLCRAGDLEKEAHTAYQGMACALEVAYFSSSMADDAPGVAGSLHVSPRRNADGKLTHVAG